MISATHCNVLLSLLVQVVIAEEGYIQDTSNGQFLFCDNNNCRWDVTPTQIFRKDSGHDGQSRFHIISSDGTDTGQCLDREHCHHGSSNARMADCNHCGAYHWQYDGNKLAEDKWNNCIQSSGSIDHCSQSHAPIKWPVAPDCEIDQQFITNFQCKNQNTGGTCGANFIKGSVVGGHSDTDCDACRAAPNSTLECDFTLGVTTTQSYSTIFTSATHIGVKAGWKFKAGVVFESAEFNFEISVDETLTTGHTTTKTRSSNVEGACKGSIIAGTRESVKANFLSGTVVGDFTATVTTKWKNCPWKKDDVQDNVEGQLTITSVPTKTLEGSCTPISNPCSDAEEIVVV